MAKFVASKEIDKYMQSLNTLSAELKKDVIGKALYEGGGIVADAVREGIETIPENEGYVPKDCKTRGIPAKAKEGLKNGLGITKMKADRNGVYSVKIGFDGYNGNETKKWPKGAPNQLVARAVERGTSWLEATPFVKKALSKSRKAAEDVMVKAVDDSIKKIMKE